MFASYLFLYGHIPYEIHKLKLYMSFYEIFQCKEYFGLHGIFNNYIIFILFDIFYWPPLLALCFHIWDYCSRKFLFRSFCLHPLLGLIRNPQQNKLYFKQFFDIKNIFELFSIFNNYELFILLDIFYWLPPTSILLSHLGPLLAKVGCYGTNLGHVLTSHSLQVS